MGEHSSLQLVERVIRVFESGMVHEEAREAANDLSTFILDGGRKYAIKAAKALGIPKGMSPKEAIKQYIGYLALRDTRSLPFLYQLSEEMGQRRVVSSRRDTGHRRYLNLS